MRNVLKIMATAFIGFGFVSTIGCSGGKGGGGVPNCSNPNSYNTPACLNSYGYPTTMGSLATAVGGPGIFVPTLGGDGRVELRLANADAISHWSLANNLCQAQGPFDCLSIVGATLTFHIDSTGAQIYNGAFGPANWRLYARDRWGGRAASDVFSGTAIRLPNGGFQIDSGTMVVSATPQNTGLLNVTVSLRAGPRMYMIGTGSIHTR